MSSFVKFVRNEAAVLAFNPWGDDDSDYRVLDNRMVVTRCAHECAICFKVINVGSRVRAQREIFDGKAKTFRFCSECCEAMAHAGLTGEIERVEARTQMGMENARRQEATR